MSYSSHPRRRRFSQRLLQKLMSVDLSKAMTFESVANFESLATTPGKRGIPIYRPERFVLNQKHQVSALSLDALVAMLVSVVAAASNSDGFSPDLDLMMVSVAALSQPVPQRKSAISRDKPFSGSCASTHFHGRKQTAPPSAASIDSKISSSPSSLPTHRFLLAFFRPIRLCQNLISSPAPSVLSMVTSGARGRSETAANQAWKAC